MLKDKIQALAKDIHNEIIHFRRHIHANPELSFHEYETAKFIQAQLEKMGIEYQSGIAGTGIVAIIRGKKEGKVIALRADMDALPILEQNEVEYKSKNQGVMHACGHDVHTSSLLGTAKILSQLTDDFSGTIKLIFQPAEEKVPGGASLMVKEGVLKNPDVKAILGQHVLPQLACGKVGIRGGKYMASADELYITIKGKGGHGAQPQSCIDPIVIAANVITTLQTIISRNSDPRLPSVLTIGKISGGTVNNVIPDEVFLEGTFRAMDEKWRFAAHDKIQNIIKSVTESMGGTAEIEIRKGYPVLFNEESLTERTKNAMIEYMGEENVVNLDIWMAAEDFAYYSHEIAGCFYRLGTRNEARNIVHGVHTSRFDIDENALAISTGLMAWLAICELKVE